MLRAEEAWDAWLLETVLDEPPANDSPSGITWSRGGMSSPLRGIGLHLESQRSRR